MTFPRRIFRGWSRRVEQEPDGHNLSLAADALLAETSS